MNTIRITLAALTLCATGFAQASEITDFAIPSTSTVSRAAVQAEAIRLNQQDLLRVDFVGPVAIKPAMSLKTRDEVRMEALAPRSSAEIMAGSYLVGGL